MARQTTPCITSLPDGGTRREWEDVIVYHDALGRRHRLNGPAVSVFGHEEWWIDGHQLTRDRWLAVVAQRAAQSLPALTSAERVRSVARQFLDSQSRPLTLSSEDLTNRFGFADGDLLRDYVDALRDAALLDVSDDERGDWILAHLVDSLLLTPLVTRGHTVSLRLVGTSHSPVRAYAVNGIVDADAPSFEASVDLDDLVTATLAAFTVGPPPARVTAASQRVASGLPDLIGRHVEVSVSVNPEENLIGELLAANDELTLLNHYDDTVIVIPREKVIAVTTHVLTVAEAEMIRGDAP